MGSSSFSIVVGSIPPPQLYSINTTNATCYGSSDGTAEIIIKYGTRPFVYNWSGNVAGIYDSTATNLPAGNYQVTIIDNNGCPLDGIVFTIGQPNQVTVSVNSVPTICIGQAAQLFASGAGGTQPYIYYWDNPEITDSNQVQTVHPSVTTIYSVYVTDDNGCSSAAKSVTVNVHPPLTIDIASPDTILCEGESTILTVNITSPGNGGPYSYFWSDIGTDATIVRTVEPVSDAIYNITVTDNCSPLATAHINIYVEPAPPINIVSNPMFGCEPMTVNFSNYGDNIGISWYWNFGDYSSPDMNTSVESNPVHVYNNDGVYDITLTVASAYGCSRTYEAEDLITVYPAPEADFMFYPQSADAFHPTIEFYDLSTGAESWYWDFGDSDNSMYQNPEHEYHGAGTYIVHLDVFSEHGCYDSISKPVVIKEVHTFYVPTAFVPKWDVEEENAYWTPEATGIAECDGCYKLWIYDRWGQIIFSTEQFYGNNKIDDNRWNGQYFNNGKMVPVGVYTWYCKLKDVNGNEHTYVGSVTVIR
ncbi:MAG: PKD domain-containing protein [Bacteroidia bacterium]|nr:PKD domain-containing protein [Bacteroidia bacterium]